MNVEANTVDDAFRLSDLMGEAAGAAGKVWEYLDPRKADEDGGHPAAGLVGAETLANFFAAATLFLRALRAIDEDIDAEINDDGEVPNDEHDGTAAAIENVRTALENAGVVVGLDVIRSLTPSQRQAALVYAEHVIGGGRPDPLPYFLK